RYAATRVAVRECATIDEAKQVQDKAEALRLYARQRDDRGLEVWMAEIRLHASMRIGELVRELDAVEHGGAGGGSKVQPAALSKDDAIEQAGLSRRTAYEYQGLAGGRSEIAQAAGVATADHT
ncbi:MAG: hypothetical protein JSS43_18970, partial [Proteobacteria bacterium]|nr:hypothetical protein [Pseudomonadota bacterium]